MTMKGIHAEAGEGVGLICDAHVHVGRIGDGRTRRAFEPVEIVEILKAHGVSEFIFSSMNSQSGASMDKIVQDAIETQTAFGRGAHAFYWLAGRFYDEDPDLKALDNEIWDGVKLHELETPWVKKRPKDLDRILSILEERDIPVQFHTGEDAGCYPHELLPFAMRHPKLRIDFAHCRPYAETIDCLRECRNLFTDTAFMPTEYYPKLIAADLEERVLFGTDLPIQGGYSDDPISELYGRELDVARRAEYSKAVMSDNFHRFLFGTISAGELQGCPQSAE